MNEARDFIHVYEPGDLARPVLLLLHGTGGNENDLVPLAEAIAPGAGVLSPRGKVLERGMPRFFRRIEEGVFDLEDLRLRTAELAAFVESAGTEYGFRDRPVVALGFSNGANIAASVLLSRPGLLGGAILFRAMTPFEPDAPIDLDGTRVLMVSGEHDPLIPPENSEQLATLLEKAGAEVRHERFPGGHGLTNRDLECAARWYGERF
jgi:phospholipase/carboxylesterase